MTNHGSETSDDIRQVLGLDQHSAGRKWVRFAVGALERDVLLQFLVEAVVLSSLGGLFGITLALIASVWLADLMQVPFVFNPDIITIAFVFSAAVGVIFGYFPARRAARLDPIEALRHE